MSQTIVTTPAPLGKKLGAWLYDALISIAIYAVWNLFTFTAFKAWVGVDDFIKDSSWQGTAEHYIYLSTHWLLVLFYFVYNHVKSGQTVGMSAWKLRLVKTDGTKVTWLQATARTITAIFGVGILSSVLSAQKRGWHDLLTGTRVVLMPEQDKAKN